MSAQVVASQNQQASFVCPECRTQSWHPEDVKEGYCGRCHFWTGDPVMYAAWKADREA